MSRARRCRLGEAILRADGTADLFLADEKVSPELRQWLGNEVAVRAERGTAAGAGGAQRQARAARSVERLGLVFRATEARRRGDRARAGSGGAAARVQERRRDRRLARSASRATARRCRASCTGWRPKRRAARSTRSSAARSWKSFARATGALKDLSFDSISGAGPNGAIVHYRVTKKTNRRLARGSLFLIDSGGQYLDGTTDITRTVAIGRPNTEMSERFTRVLKGHIALARVRFPEGHHRPSARCAGAHELVGGGARLRSRHRPRRRRRISACTKARTASPNAVNTQPLEPGMIVSNEPGYYKTGAYGIRIENLQVVTPAADVAGGERPMLGFETLTLAPIDRALMVKTAADQGRARVAQRLSRARARSDRRAAGGRGEGVVGKCDGAAVTSVPSPPAGEKVARSAG